MSIENYKWRTKHGFWWFEADGQDLRVCINRDGFWWIENERTGIRHGKESRVNSPTSTAKKNSRKALKEFLQNQGGTKK